MLVDKPDILPFEKRFAQYDDKHCPGLAVMVIEDGATKFRNGYGLSNLKTKEKINYDTNFGMASVSKQFTAMCIAILEEKKQLSSDDYISQYFHDLPNYMSSIKIKHLIHHLSGLPDYSSYLWSSNKKKPLISNHDVYAFYKNAKKLDFKAGDRFEYSNGGYSLLPLLIENATGQSFPDFINNSIFEPANMKNTAIFEYPSNISNQATSYSEWPFFEDIDFNTGNALQGEGGVYTSLADMQAWIHAIENNTLIGPAMTEKVFSAVQDNNGNKVNYGYGWSFGEMYKHKVIVHTGGWAGFNTVIAKVPDRKIWFVAFSNTEAIDAENAALEMAKYYLDIDPEMF
ncbi:MAG: serine hydrolase domain-containing protein [Geminicoccales bacterium]